MTLTYLIPVPGTVIDGSLLEGWQHFTFRVHATPELLQSILTHVHMSHTFASKVKESSTWDTRDRDLRQRGLTLSRVQDSLHPSTFTWSLRDSKGVESRAYCDEDDSIHRFLETNNLPPIGSDSYRSIANFRVQTWDLILGVKLCVTSWLGSDHERFYPTIIAWESVSYQILYELWGKIMAPSTTDVYTYDTSRVGDANEHVRLAMELATLTPDDLPQERFGRLYSRTFREAYGLLSDSE